MVVTAGARSSAAEEEGGGPTVVYVASSAYVFLNFFLERLRAMRARGFSVVVCCPEDGPVGRFEAEGFEWVRIPMERSVNPAAAAVTWLLLHSLFIERAPLIVHSHTTTVHLIAALAARSAGVPVCVATIHGHYETGLDALVGASRAAVVTPLAGLYAAQVGRLVDAYLVINATERRSVEARGLVPAEKIHLIEGGVGVDLRRFDGGSGRLEARRRLRLPEGQRQLGFIGRLKDHKARDLWAIIDRVQQAEPDVGVLLALVLDGDAPLERGLAERVEAGRAIVVVRDRAPEEMPLIYKALDVLALPSYREGASTVLMEAAAMRVPAVAYDIAGTRDLIEPGRTGQLTPVGDPEALAGAALELLRSSTARRDMGAAARARAAARFDRDRVQDQVFALYDRLLDVKVRPFDER